jgi:hypothetical protein
MIGNNKYFSCDEIEKNLIGWHESHFDEKKGV